VVRLAIVAVFTFFTLTVAKSYSLKLICVRYSEHIFYTIVKKMEQEKVF
jgi:hypothetical protein